ncbi:MAG: hypothetical protein V1907_00785 [Candidatus Kerfeldbacteria bacterium]
MFLDRLHEVSPPPVDPLVLHRRHRRKRKAKQWGSVLLVLGIAGAFVWWYFGTGGSVVDSVSIENSRMTLQENENVNSGETSLSSADTDNDGFSDELEMLYGTDPDKADTDSDGFDDSMEVENGYNPLNPGKGIRMVDLALVSTLAKGDADTTIVSSGQSAGDSERYYALFDGTSMTYYAADGTVKAQCPLNEEPKETCSTLPNEVRTDFSRTYEGTSFTDEYHVPF